MPPALELARRYAEALAALRAVHEFDGWLGDHWHEACPVQRDSPTAVTPLGTAGTIRWYEAHDSVVGYLPGEDGCFRMTRSEAMPAFLPASDAPHPFQHDILISTAMQDIDGDLGEG